jgi:hypothetical protein
VLLLALKKLLSYSKLYGEPSAKTVLLAGDSLFISLLKNALDSTLITAKHLTISDNIAPKINFYPEIFIPESYSYIFKFKQKAGDLKFTFADENILFPVINNIDLFRECYKSFFKKNSRDMDKFINFLDKRILINGYAENYLKDNFSHVLNNIIYSILKFYNCYPFQQIKIKHLQKILKNFFSKNIMLHQDKSNSNFFNNNLKIKKLKSSIIVNGTPHSFDFFVSDIPHLMENKIEFTENILEFKIKKDYTTEYFPKTLIFKINNDFIKLFLNFEDNKYKYFILKGFSNIDFLYGFFKKFFPNLAEKDIISIKEGQLNLINFQFKGENFPFNLMEKIIFIKEEVLRNGKKKRND